MLIKVTSNRAADYFNLVRSALFETIPNCNESYCNRMLERILLDEVDVWLLYHLEGGSEIVEGISLTAIIDSWTVGERVFSIISLWCPDGMELQSLREARDMARKYAKKFNCTYFEFFTANEKIIHFLEAFDTMHECKYFIGKL